MIKIICVILTLILVFSAAFAGYQIFREYSERKESADTYTDLEDLIDTGSCHFLRLTAYKQIRTV